MNNRRQFILRRQIDGRPFYWNANLREWDCEEARAKVYRRLAVAEQLGAEYGGEVVELNPKPALLSYKQLVIERDYWKQQAQAASNLADMQTEIIRAALAWHQAIEELNGVQAAEDRLRALLRDI